MRQTALVSRLALAVECTAALASPALAKGVEPRFDLDDPAGAPFPSDRYTVPEADHLTGLRVNLPKPDCSTRPTDCENV